MIRSNRKHTHRWTPYLEMLETREVLSATFTGPSSSATPYLVPTIGGVDITSIMTVGDSVNLKPDGVTPYRAVGIMDGLGAFDNNDGTFTLVMNHEIGGSISGGVITPSGIAREHGNAGAFVSLWTIRKSDLTVLKVEDFLTNNTSIFLSNNDQGSGMIHTGYLPGTTTVIQRLCSADLAPGTAYAWTDPLTGTFYGTTARIFQTGEESGGTATSAAGGGVLGEPTVHFGRQWNMILTDDPNIPGDQSRTAFEMPHCGLFSWENNLANPLAQRITITAGMDDTSPGQVYFWVGEKQTTGNVVERAGLTRQSASDNLWVVRVDGLTPDASGATNEDRNTPLNGTFQLLKAGIDGDASGLTLAQLEANSDGKGATQFLRPEDGQWDPNNPSDYYFVTTDRYDQVKDGVGATVGRSRLYRMHFTDIAHPELGGTIEAVLDGTEAGNMFDNMTIDQNGRAYLQEDVGGQAHLGKIFMYDIATDQLVEIAQHDPARFGTFGVPATAPFNNDEESSGIIDVSDILGPGKFLADVQAHYSLGGELVEGGQLLLIDTNAAEVSLEDGVLTVGGTINDDEISVSRHGHTITVTQNGDVLGQFDARGVDTLRIDAGAGNDVVTVSHLVKADALIRGGLGDDTLSGGGRRNVLVGGAGSDTLVGDSQGDVLIGGEVTDDDALDAAFAAWIGDGSYHSRASAVGSTLSGQIVDDEFDLLTGLGSLDLFFHSDDDVSDGHGSEVATTV